MIKVALKHWIYEKCIDVLFKGISRNFIHPQIEAVEVGEGLMIIPGSTYASIICFDGINFTMYNRVYIFDLPDINDYLSIEYNDSSSSTGRKVDTILKRDVKNIND